MNAMKLKKKMTRFVALNFIKKGIFKGGPAWILLGVLTVFVKLVSVLESEEKKYFSTELKLGDKASFIHSSDGLWRK